ncbi:hypothetical protein ACFOPX_06680 [Helicobacter baculiformis]|uniref:Uncharacterized protein n=1 Tax=Helicobacter baculiformis TaxID=427351 RepID=A0ABV7ZM39_9HELI|nr:hypothetical protein [Helicobacter baculiformis]
MEERLLCMLLCKIQQAPAKQGVELEQTQEPQLQEHREVERSRQLQESLEEQELLQSITIFKMKSKKS